MVRLESYQAVVKSMFQDSKKKYLVDAKILKIL